jgi:hypothetical protein
MASISQEELAEKIQLRTKQVRDLILAGPPEPPDDRPPELPPHIGQEHRARVEGCSAAIETYETGVSSARVAIEAYLASLDDYEGEVRKASDDATYVRKTHYLNVERESIETWNLYFSMALLCIAAVYAKHSFYDLRLYKNAVVWVVLAVLISLAVWTTAVIRKIVRMPRAVSIYSTWANPESAEWHGGDPSQR